MSNVIEVFQAHVRLRPNATALRHDGDEWTYAELNAYANKLAVAFSDRVSSAPVIAIAGRKSVDMVAAILATLKLGGCYLPIDDTVPPDRIAFMLKNANAALVVAAVGSELRLPAEADLLELDATAFDRSENHPNLTVQITAETPAYIMHTSGSTGAPKGVLMPHRGLLRLLIDANYISLSANDVVLFHSNTSFDAGIFEVWAALLNGGTLVIASGLPGDLLKVYRYCETEGITILLLATGLFHIFANMDLAKLTSMRYLVVGGDVMHYAQALKAIKANSHTKIINGYGPAENCVFTTCHVIASEEDLANPIPIGRAITGTQVFLLDDNGAEVAPGEVGELCISGLGVAHGYINAEALTAEKFVSMPAICEHGLVYRTGDLVKQLSNGLYEFVGRCDNQVKIRGFRVELTEIETTLSALPAVADACVCVLDGKAKQLAAFVKVIDDQIDEKSIKQALALTLPSYSVPSRITICDDFPVTANGKIDRRKLQVTMSNAS